MLEVKGLSTGYNGRDVLQDISFRVNRGEAVCLLGKNGSGKSTLLKAVLGLASHRGEIRHNGQSIHGLAPSALAKVFAYIPQKPKTDFAYTVREMVVMGRTAHLGALAQPGKADYHLAEGQLERLGIGHLAGRSILTLSGGEARLVSIARAVCQQAAFLLMDEPTAELDYQNQLQIQRAVLELKKQGIGFLIATHAPDLPFQLADRILLLGEGRCLGFGIPEEILVPPKLEEAFGVPMETVRVTDRFGRVKQLCYAISPPEQDKE